MANARVDPLVPVPAPALISPVACSSTIISIVLNLLLDPVLTFFVTLLKILFPFTSLIDLFTSISLYASPSSTNNAFLITFSCVI